MAWGMIAVSAGTAIISGVMQAQANKKSRDRAEGLAEDARIEQEEQQQLLEEEKRKYEEMEFVNQYKDMANPYANMQNTYEDMTINQQQAQFEAQVGAQQRANIMQGLRGAAGTSGIAGLAQAMANQGALQAQAMSASIGLQEGRIQQLQAGEGSRLQTLERQGEMQTDLLRRQGEVAKQAFEHDRQSTLLGMQYGAATGANTAYREAQEYEMDVQAANEQAMVDVITSGIGGLGTTIAGADFSSVGGGGAPKGTITTDTASYASIEDANLAEPGSTSYYPSGRILKKNINLIGKSPSGLNIYSFEYINSKYGEGLFQGVMSDEIPQEAVSNTNGYDMVNYNMLDVEFKQI